MSAQRHLLLATAILCVGGGCAACFAVDGPATEYLSDTLAERMVSVTQGWGELGLNTSVRPLHKPPMKLRIKDKEYQHGLGHHASGEIAVELGGQFKAFETDVGIQWQGGSNQASVIFQVFVDDKKVFDSGVMRETDPPRHVSVSVEGAEELRLVADEAGDGITCDCANWADARLTRNPAAKKRPLATGVDIAPFGKVATWDPKQMNGTKAGRVDEIPAEDLFPAKDLLPAADGSYKVPDWSGTGCIGLRWDENRLVRQLVLCFADAASVPPVESIQLHCWTGESAWQGAWQVAKVVPEKVDSSLVWSLGYQGFARGTQKVRFVFAGMKQPVVLKAISAFTRSAWTTVDVRIQSTRSGSASNAEIELYNGVILAPGGETASVAGGEGGSSPLSRAGRGAGGEGSPHLLAWDPAKPLELKIRSAVSKRYKADRTVLRFRFPDTAFAVAIEDLLANDCVYVPHAGLFVTRLPAPITLDEYLKKNAAKSSVLAQVRKLPDQSFERAMAVVHNPIQDLGPMMLSLACDNRKFVVHREGTIVFDEYNGPDDPPRDIPDQWQIVPRFGSGKNLKITRKLPVQWLPMPATIVADGDVVYGHQTYVGPIGDAPTGGPPWLRERALCVVEFFVGTHSGKGAADASFAFNLIGAKKQPLEFKDFNDGVLALSGGRVLAVIVTKRAAPMSVKREPAGLAFSGKVPALTPESEPIHVAIYLPAWNAVPNESEALGKPEELTNARMMDYWAKLLTPAIDIDLPDVFLNHVIRASQVHCMLAARNEDHGKLVSPWISSDRYGPLESEANSIIRGMDMTGHADFARRSLEFFIKRYNKQAT